MSQVLEKKRNYQIPRYALSRKAAPPSLSIVAREVMSGEWGKGAARDQKLKDAGYDLDEVYNKIDEMFGTETLPFEPYKVMIDVPSLNVRQGPSLDHYIVCMLLDDRTEYVIVEEEIDDNANIWGFLRSGLGWINLEHTKRVDERKQSKWEENSTEQLDTQIL